LPVVVYNFQAAQARKRRLGHLPLLPGQRQSDHGDHSFIVDGIRDHPIFTLMVEHHPELVFGEMRVEVAISQRVEKGIPLPHPDVMDDRRRHRLAGEEEARAEQPGPEYPPR